MDDVVSPRLSRPNNLSSEEEEKKPTGDYLGSFVVASLSVTNSYIL